MLMCHVVSSPEGFSERLVGMGRSVAQCSDRGGWEVSGGWVGISEVVLDVSGVLSSSRDSSSRSASKGACEVSGGCVGSVESGGYADGVLLSPSDSSWRSDSGALVAISGSSAVWTAPGSGFLCTLIP